jgi:hypothetical protein
VFNSVGGKVALLKLALDWAIVGDDEPIALADRPWPGRWARGSSASAGRDVEPLRDLLRQHRIQPEDKTA